MQNNISYTKIIIVYYNWINKILYIIIGLTNYFLHYIIIYPINSILFECVFY